MNPFTPAIRPDTAALILHAATVDAATTGEVADLDDQVATVVAALLALTSDPDKVAAKAAAGLCDPKGREERLRHVTRWRDAEKINALGAATEASQRLAEVLTEHGNVPHPAVEEAEANHMAALDRYQIADAAADAANVALAQLLNDQRTQ